MGTFWPTYNWKSLRNQIHKPKCFLRSSAPRPYRKKTKEEENGSASKRDSVHPNTKQQQRGQSVPAPSVSNKPEDNMIRVVTDTADYERTQECSIRES
jgi:hypothetical protein